MYTVSKIADALLYIYKLMFVWKKSWASNINHMNWNLSKFPRFRKNRPGFPQPVGIVCT